MSSLDYGCTSDEIQEEDIFTGFLDDEGGDDEDTSTSSESSDMEEQCDNDDEEGGIIRIRQANLVWSGQELKIVAELKDWWFYGNSEQQTELVDEAVTALNDIEPRDQEKLRKKIQKWLKNRAGKRLSYGPGNRPSFQTVLAYYKEAEVTEAVWEKYRAVPGGRRSPFLGLWKKELGQLQKAMKTDPSLKDQFDRLEAARDEWTRRGPPRERRKKMAEKKTTKMVMDFAGRMYFELGARCSFSVGYRNTDNQPCVGHFDFNGSLGHGKKDFLNKHSGAVKPYEKTWDQYIAKNLTDNENNDSDEDLIPIRLRKLSKKQVDIIFDSSPNGEPLLPSDCVTKTLEDRKHIMRCFLKAHYGIAKGITYPSTGCTPPWVMVMASPRSFFKAKAIPNGVEIKDPSKMTHGPITQCLTHWINLQNAGLGTFKFIKVWSETRGDYVEAVEGREIIKSLTGPTVGARGSKQWKGKGREQSDQKKPVGMVKAEGLKHRKGKGKAQSPVNKHPSSHTNWEKTANIQWGYAEGQPTNVEQGTEHLLTGSHTNWEKTANIQWGNAEGQPTNPEHGAEQWPIDPMLQNYPTNGPSDPVPLGFNPVPSTYMREVPVHGPVVRHIQPDSNQPEWVTHVLQKMEQMEQKIMDLTKPDAPKYNFPPPPSSALPSVHITTGISLPPSVNSNRLPIPAPICVPPLADKTTLPKSVSLPSNTAEPSRPRTWPSKLTPRQTRRQAKERGVTVPPIAVLIKKEKSPPQFGRPLTQLRVKEEGVSIPPIEDICNVKEEILDDNAFSLAPAALDSNRFSRKRPTKTELQSEEPERKKRNTGNMMPKPRLLRKRNKGSNGEESEHFSMKGRRKGGKL